MFSSCGLPSPTERIEPPSVIEEIVDPQGVRILLRNASAFNIYYKVYPIGQAVWEDFSRAQYTNGERVLSDYGYIRCNSSSGYLWTPAGRAAPAAEAVITYASNALEATTRVTGDPQGVITIYRNKEQTALNIGFKSPMQSYRDNGATVGAVEISLAAISYKLDTTTMQLIPSFPTYLGTMRNLTIN